jgi:hypothetical protein
LTNDFDSYSASSKSARVNESIWACGDRYGAAGSVACTTIMALTADTAF